MTAGIFLIREGNELVELAATPYESEARLQELLAHHPNLLAGDQIDAQAPRRWLLLTREATIPADAEGNSRWSLDHLFLDQDGIPTLVEVKRSTDTRIRREVVGQMLDYAANGVAYWPVETVRALFETRQEQAGRDPGVVLSEFLRNETTPDSFWLTVKTNLQAGRIRLVFVADEIPPELRRVVEFLNSQMDPAEVLAIEVKHYTGGGVRGLVPRLLGRTEQSAQKKGTARNKRHWSETSFFRELIERRGEAEAQVARRIYEWTEDNGGRITFGTGQQDGSFFVSLEHHGTTYYPLAVWTYGRVEVQLQYLRQKPAFQSEERRREILQRLNEIPGVDLSADAIARRPSIPLETLRAPGAVDAVLSTLTWIAAVIRADPENGPHPEAPWKHDEGLR